ncbi:MAG: hypothetical protein MHPSP_001325, partial [Paramarteilia canceri]
MPAISSEVRRSINLDGDSLEDFLDKFTVSENVLDRFGQGCGNVDEFLSPSEIAIRHHFRTDQRGERVGK